MRRQVVITAIVLTLSGCHMGLPESQCEGGTQQCSNSILQSCYADEPFGGAYWHSDQWCAPSQVCRLNATPPGAESGTPTATGCFSPNAYCQEGSLECSSTATESLLWSCSLQSSDQTVRWVRTICSAQIPLAICAAQYSEATGTWTNGCYEVVANCQGSESHCEGNVLFACSTVPNVIDNKAVFDWNTRDCSQDKLVCKVGTSGADCVPP
jgi:hypothetical protein